MTASSCSTPSRLRCGRRIAENPWKYTDFGPWPRSKLPRRFGARASAASIGDIRRGRPYLLAAARCATSRSALGSVVCAGRSSTSSRSASASTAALALRELYYGQHADPLGRALGRGGRVAAVRRARHRARLLAGRALRRARAARRLRAGRLVARRSSPCSSLAFGLGTGHDFNTFGLIPTALVDRRASSIGLLRASYETISREVLHAARRAPARDRRRRRGAPRCSCSGRSAPCAAGSTTSSSASSRRLRRPSSPLPRARPGRRPARRSSSEHAVDELIVTDSDFSERRAARRSSSTRTRSGVKVRIAPKTTELLVAARRVRARARACRCSSCGRRCSPAPTGRSSASFDLIVSALVVVARPAAVARDRRGDQAHLAAARSSTATRGVGLGERTFEMFKFRTMYADAAEQQAELETAQRGRRGALQDPRRPARHPGRRASSGASRSTSCRTCSTSCAAR